MSKTSHATHHPLSFSPAHKAGSWKLRPGRRPSHITEEAQIAESLLGGCQTEECSSCTGRWPRKKESFTVCGPEREACLSPKLPYPNIQITLVTTTSQSSPERGRARRWHSSVASKDEAFGLEEVGTECSRCRDLPKRTTETAESAEGSGQGSLWLQRRREEWEAWKTGLWRQVQLPQQVPSGVFQRHLGACDL